MIKAPLLLYVMEIRSEDVIVAVLLDLRIEQMDIAAAHGDDQVAGLPVRAEEALRVVKRRGVVHALARRGNGVHEHGGMDVAGVLFPRGEDVRDQDLVGKIAAVDVVRKEGLDAGIGVRLHDGEEPVMRLMGGILQRAVHLGGVVAVIGVELHAADRARMLKAPVRRSEAGEGFGDDAGVCTDLHAGGDGRQRMHDVVLAGDVQHAP